MSIEDRLRAATRARAALVRDLRPLDLPDDPPAPGRRTGGIRRRLTWGDPGVAWHEPGQRNE
jgi:hypothetical protein